MIFYECPMRDEKISILDDIEIGDLIDCEECDREFEVVSAQPLELEWVDEEEEVFYEDDENFYWWNGE